MFSPRINQICSDKSLLFLLVLFKCGHLLFHSSCLITKGVGEEKGLTLYMIIQDDNLDSHY